MRSLFTDILATMLGQRAPRAGYTTTNQTGESMKNNGRTNRLFALVRNFLAAIGAVAVMVAVMFVLVSGVSVAKRHVHRVARVLGMFNGLFAVGASDLANTDPTLNGRQVFPPGDPWNTDISKEPVDPHSDLLIASINPDKSLHPDFGTTLDGEPWGIPYVVVPGNQPRSPTT